MQDPTTGVRVVGYYSSRVLRRVWGLPRALRSMALSGRLALALAAAAAIPLLAVVPLYAWEQQGQTVAGALQQQQTLALALAQDVSDYVRLHGAALQQLASDPKLLALEPAEQQVRLRRVLAAYADVRSFSTVSAEGQPIARSDDLQGVSWLGVPVFEIARATRQPSLSVRTSPIINRPVLSFGAPILDGDGRFIGMVSEVLESSRIQEVLRRTDADRDATIYLIDPTGRAIAHPDDELVSAAADFSERPAVAAFLASQGDSGALRSDEPDGVLAGYARVPELGWGLIVERPTAVVLAPTREKLELVFWGLLLTIAGAAAVGGLAARQLTRPLAALALAVRRLADGGIDAPHRAAGCRRS